MPTPMPWADWPKRVPLSREGLFWFLVAAAMLTTGLVKGINLVTLLACFLVALVLGNYLLARRQLRRVRVQRLEEEPIFAGKPFSWAVRVRNPGRHPASGIRVSDGAGGQEQSWFVPSLAAGASLVLRAEAVFPRRGAVEGGPLTRASGYPLGLANVVRAEAAPWSRVVLPAPGTLDRRALRHLLTRQSPSVGLARGAPSRHPTAQTEFHGLRPYRPGDSPRHVHWRTSARRNALVVREYEELPNEDLTLVVEAWSPGRVRVAGEAAEDDVLERTLRVAATVCWEWCRRNGDRLGLVLIGDRPVWLAGVTGLPLALQVLERLALEPGSPSTGAAAVAGLLEGRRPPTGPVLVLSSRGAELAADVERLLHRRVAAVDVRAGGDAEFFTP